MPLQVALDTQVAIKIVVVSSGIFAGPPPPALPRVLASSSRLCTFVAAALS